MKKMLGFEKTISPLLILLLSLIWAHTGNSGIVASSNQEEGLVFSFLMPNPMPESSRHILTVGTCPQVSPGQHANCETYFIGAPEEFCDAHRRTRAARTTTISSIKTLGGIFLSFIIPPLGIPTAIQIATSVATTGYDVYSSVDAWSQKCGGDSFVDEILAIAKNENTTTVENGKISPYSHYLASLQDPNRPVLVKTVIRNINGQFLIEFK